eukprot:2051414-Amphidinium_carterae.1
MRLRLGRRVYVADYLALVPLGWSLKLLPTVDVCCRKPSWMSLWQWLAAIVGLQLMNHELSRRRYRTVQNPTS